MKLSRFGLWLGGLATLILLAARLPAATLVHAQQPTGSIPTVTGTPLGPRITVNLDQDFVNVRSGPSSFYYPRIGILMRGESAPALGRSLDNQWIQIEYLGVPGNVGWVFAANVTLSSQALPFVDAPPTPTSRATPTINPTLQAAYSTPIAPTALETFTPAAPVEPPAFSDVPVSATAAPMGLLIFAFGVVGVLVAVVSLLRGR
ncbi:MAG: SH3 domain-containing protein [Chloroflexota bacterium]